MRRFGEKGIERGSGFGPWTVHVSFRADDVAVNGFVGRDDLAGSISRYAEPAAEGISPVFKTAATKIVSTYEWRIVGNFARISHIFS